MGRRGRKQILQLGDNSDSFLAKYGYNRQEEEVPGNDESEEEVEDEGKSNSTSEVIKTKENGDLIDDKVADFLAELEKPDSNDMIERPSLGVDTEPQIGFQLNPDQKPSYDQKQSYEPKTSFAKEPEPTFVSNKARSMYKNMFVKGDSEFTGKNDKGKSSSKKDAEVEWPEEPTTVWEQTLDDNTQCYYYWNTVTNNVTWEIPPDFTQYLLQKKSYEEKVAKLKKEGRVKPVKKIEEKTPEQLLEISLPQKSVPVAISKDKGSSKQESTVREDKPKDSKPLPATSSMTRLSALTAYADSDEESSASESEGEEDKKKKGKKKKESDDDVDMMDIDDIDKALESALESKKPEKEASGSDKKDKSESKPNLPKKLTLIDSIKEQVKLKMETEARRKAAIEEMMARELERRVGPPRKRSTEEETVWDSKRPKIVDYGHSRSRSPDAVRTDDRESRSRRHDRERDRDRDKDSDRHSHKEKKKKKDKDKDKDKDDHRHRDDKRRDHDKHDKDHKDRKKDKKKDKEDKKRDRDDRKDRDEKKDKEKEKEKDRDKEKRKEKHEERDKKSDEKNKEKLEEKLTEDEVKVEMQVEDMDIIKDERSDDIEQEEVAVKQEVEVPPVIKKTMEVDIDAELENIVTGTVKVDVELANKKMQASELADLALSKLEFLEVTKKGLSKLQILLVELETRHQDWQAGGLNTEFYLVKLDEANWQLEQYEKSAAPPGWSCHWDRSYRRYFYMNKRSKQTQWDYPDDEEEEEPESSPEQGSIGNKEPVRPVPPRMHESEVVTSTTLEQEEVTTTKDVVSSTKDSVEEPQSSGQGWPNYEAVTNYISGTEFSGVIRGEPPPPGTDLELLLTAPPPPPPPLEGDTDDTINTLSYNVPGPPEGTQEVDTSSIDDIDGEAMLEEAEVSESANNVETTEQQYDDNGVEPQSDSTVIARAPQIFTENQYSSYYDPSVAMSEQYQDGGQYYADGGVDTTGAIETVAMGDAASLQHDKEKRKKKKDKQSSGQLKNKNVSNLVQKWQKVKKEVEIEEQQREERQQAIRQKLDEWKKEHS